MAGASIVHRLTIPLTFPAGISPGAGKDEGNRLVLSVDGRGRPVLRGTAVAGVLRHAWARHVGIVSANDPRLEERFGGPCEGERGADRPSPLRVQDVLLDPGRGGVELRHHNSIDRHTGAVRKGGLFSLDSLPPGTSGALRLSFQEDAPWAREFLAEIVGLLEAGLVLGGHGARGVGLARRVGDARVERFDLKSIEGLGRWLDASRSERSENGTPQATGDSLSPATTSDVLRVELTLGIPRGQDICIGDGQGLDHVLEPQSVLCADGKQRFRIPGSSLRGVLRAWITRLAARDGHAVADSHAEFRKRGPVAGDEVAWSFASAEERESIQDDLESGAATIEQRISCPILQLFGSLYGTGRIHIQDAISIEEHAEKHLQSRKHVSVDRITGGANEGFLFDHQALLAGVKFPVTIVVREPKAEEAQWLADALRALEMGVLRIGTSKSSGRLALVGPVKARGPHAQTFKSLVPREV